MSTFIYNRVTDRFTVIDGEIRWETTPEILIAMLEYRDEERDAEHDEPEYDE